jgi:hypothetical protein
MALVWIESEGFWKAEPQNYGSKEKQKSTLAGAHLFENLNPVCEPVRGIIFNSLKMIPLMTP